jgi:tetratricopeptide (TPR) repeat protein
MKKIGLGSRPSEIKKNDKRIELDHHLDEGVTPDASREAVIITRKPPAKRSSFRKYLLAGLVLGLLAGGLLALYQAGLSPLEGLQGIFSSAIALDHVEFATGEQTISVKDGETFAVTYKDGLSIRRIACKGWYKLFPPDDIQTEISEIGKLPNYYQENIIPLLKPEKTTSYQMIFWKGDNRIGTMNFTLKMDAGDWMARAEAVKDKEIKNICFKNAVSANPESEDARLGLAKSFEDKKQTKNAISEYEEILKKNPRNTEVLTALIPLYAQTRKTGKLIETYKVLASVDRGKADQYYFKAATAAEKSSLAAEAIDLYKKSLAANSANTEVRQKLIKLYEKENQWNLVAENTQELLKQEPRNANLYLYLSDAYLKTNRLNQAISAAEKAAKLNPKDAAAQLQCALLYEKAKQDDKAIEAYQKLVSLKPRHSAAYNNLGMLQEKKGNRKSAIENYEKAVSLDPDNKVFLINLADAYEKEKDWDRAVAVYEKVVKADKDFKGAWEALAVLNVKTGRENNAIRAYRELSRIEPKNVLWHKRLAALFEKQGNLAEAKKEYRAVLKLNPRDKEANQRMFDISIRSLEKKHKK